ncbi:hypothetical protein KAM481_21480 [Aeromonas caviae]|uniref:hypothetical protein n=1 Tax=Aeromonas TaxID=642 RepID=UPI001FBBD650|nr:hypothetical protein [Aeromonas caviae]GKR78678.1 hypothetical protein KAM481_21480 [Aeromonas caviae]
MLIRILKKLLLWCGDDSYQRQATRIKDADVLNDALLKKAVCLVEERDVKATALEHAELRIQRLLSELNDMDEASQTQASIIRSMGSKQRDLEDKLYELQQWETRYRQMIHKLTPKDQTPKIIKVDAESTAVLPPYSRDECQACGGIGPYCRCSN